jgi:GNAT superfamily N-acetyltransferase
VERKSSAPSGFIKLTKGPIGEAVDDPGHFSKLYSMSIHLAQTDQAIAACFPVMHQLRPLLKEPDFVARVRLQEREGYHLAYAEHEGRPVAVAGFRIITYLIWGRTLYVDDLVTDAAARSGGHGHRLLNWLVDYAKARNCDEFHLDSGVQRFDAHRFYLRERMAIIAHHFAMKLR